MSSVPIKLHRVLWNVELNLKNVGLCSILWIEKPSMDLRIEPEKKCRIEVL